MLLELAESHFGSLSHNIPEVKVKNLYRVANPLSVTGFSYVTRPVVSPFITMPEGNIRGVYYQQGFNNDSLIVVSARTVYSVTDTGIITPIGTIDGTDVCKFASTIFGICIVSGGGLYIYDAGTFIRVAIPDDLTPTDVTSLNNYFVISVKNSNKYFWIEPGEITIDPLSFASAEADADDVIAVQSTSDELWLIGRTSTEVWAASGDADAPFTRISGRIFNIGCASELSVTSGVFNSLPCLFWVSDSLEVIIAQGSPSKISNDFIEEVLRSSTRYYCWFFRKQRNDFYIISTNTKTLVYDVSTQSWSDWATLGQDTWKISRGVAKNTLLFGADILNSPMLYKLGTGSKDDGLEWLVAEVTGFTPHNNRVPLDCASVEVVTNPGFSADYGTEPIVEVRWSDDQGVNWSDYRQASLGNRGQANERIEFRSLGKIRIPGRRFEFRFSFDQPFRLDYAMINREI